MNKLSFFLSLKLKSPSCSFVLPIYLDEHCFNVFVRLITFSQKMLRFVAEKASWDQTNREEIFGLKKRKKEEIWLIVNDLLSGTLTSYS
jgi:hypothetical protein